MTELSSQTPPPEEFDHDRSVPASMYPTDLAATVSILETVARVQDMSEMLRRSGVLDSIVRVQDMSEMLRRSGVLDSIVRVQDMSEMLRRSGVLDSIFQAVLVARRADGYLMEIVEAIQPGLQLALAAQIGAVSHISTLIEQHSALLANMRPLADVARPVVLAACAWQDVVRVTPDDDTGRYLERFASVGRGTGWAVHAGIALTEPDEGRVADLEAEAGVALGPAVASADLRLRLLDLHPNLSDRLDGAWERILGGGADAKSQAANSLMELIDWTLRLLAPDAEVLVWHSAGNRPSVELHEGRPTRNLRLRFAVRDHPEKNSVLNLYLKSVQDLVKVIQAPKHSLELSHERALVPVALTVEGLLHFLLVD